MSTVRITPLATYRNDSPYPFCPGCGHRPILDRLNEALVGLQLDPRDVVLVSDIGCSGLSDQYFVTSAFHGLHGRSVTYASGIKLARPELTVIVLMGDGGAGIGGHHLINAARRNIGVTVLVFNNFNYGMTGGQHSATTPPGALTTTTPAGNLEHPLDICATVAVNGAAYVCRATSFDADLTRRITDAIQHPGFALIDVWELCTAYFLPANKWSRKSLQATLDRLGLATGVLEDRRQQLSRTYRELAAGEPDPGGLEPEPLEPRFRSTLDRRFALTVAGSAGQRVGSAVRLAARAAVLSGLWAAERSDHPVTVQTGFSLSELILGPQPIDHAGVERPDALAVLSEDGLRRVRPQLESLAPGARLFTVPALAAATGATPEALLEPEVRGLPKGSVALAYVTALCRRLALVPGDAMLAAAGSAPEAYREASARAVAAGLAAGPSPATG